MLGPQNPLTCLQRLSIQRFGLGEVPPPVQQDREIVEGRQRERMFGAQHLLAYLERAPVQRLSTRVASRVFMIASDCVEQARKLCRWEVWLSIGHGAAIHFHGVVMLAENQPKSHQFPFPALGGTQTQEGGQVGKKVLKRLPFASISQQRR